MKELNTTRKIRRVFLTAFLGFTLLFGACSNSDSANDQVIRLPNGNSNANDWDEDGLSNTVELSVYHTNPYDSDTDGDGFSDYDEAINLFNRTTNNFSPVIADTPDIQVDICGTPSITLIKTYSDGTTESESLTDSTSTSKSSSESNTHSSTRSWEGGFTVGATYTENWGVKTGADRSLSINASTSWKWVRGSTNSFSDSTALSLAKSYADTRAKSATKTVNYTGGIISVPVKIKNKSNVSYVLNNMMLEAYKISYDGSNAQNTKAVANLYPTTAAAAEPTLLNATISAGGETGEIRFSSGQIPVATVEGILNGLIGLRVEVSTIKISSEDTKDFTKITTAVGAKTALMTIDYGPCFDSTVMPIAKSLPETKSFQIATKRVPVSNQNATPTSFKDLTLTEALEDCLPNVVTYKEDDKGHKMIKSINGVEGKFTNPEGMEGDWFIAVVTYENSIAKVTYYGPSKAEYYYNADKITVHAEDNITVMYSVDKDGDGIPLREEDLFGTSDDKVDTDGDTISDYNELTGWKVTVAPGAGITTCTNPALKDTDGDGLEDNEDPYPTISSALSNARLAEMNISYKPFNRTPYDTGKNLSLDFAIIDSKVLKNFECEILKLNSVDASATNSDGSSQTVYAFNAGTIPSSAFILTPKLPYGSATYEYYLINGWAERDQSIEGVTEFGNKTYAGLTRAEYENKIALTASATDDGTLQLDSLPIGKFKIALKVTSSDGSKHVWYVMRFDAPLEIPSNPRASITTTDGDTATVALSWARTTDTRASNVLVVRYLTGEPQSFVPDHDLIVAAENNSGVQTNPTEPQMYLVFPTDSNTSTDQIAWSSGYWYCFFTYHKDENTNTYSTSEFSAPVNAISELPATFSVSAKFEKLTITDDFGDPGHTFELVWTIWKTLDNGTEELVCDHTDEWEGDFDNVRASSWYSFANEDATATFATLDKTKNHTLNVHIRLHEYDDHGSDDDIDNVNFDLVYDAETKTLKYDPNIHNTGADSLSTLTPSEFTFGTPTQVRFNFDTKPAHKSVKGYFDLTLLWGK